MKSYGYNALYSYLSMKQRQAIKGEKTGINFPYLSKLKKETPPQKAVRKLSGN